MPKLVGNLPIIDLSELDNNESSAHFYENLRITAREIGFFYLRGHGIDLAKIRAIEKQTRAFFELPQAQKDAIDMKNSPHFRGYTAIKTEITRKKLDYREQIDIGAELPVFATNPTSPAWHKLQGPNLWPESLPEFKPLILDWQASLRELSIRLLRAFMHALGQPANALDHLIDGTPAHLLKLIHYPSSDNSEDTQGVGAHKDNGILTLLLQDTVGGLQVETSAGWIDVAPVADAFIINIGETLELATNGYLRANVHRVITPKHGQDRYSIAYFLSPDLTSTIPLLPLDKELAKLALGPESDPDNPLFRSVGDNALKGRLRSHLEVTKRFYPEQYAQGNIY
ncbi:2-oxobutyrate oxidase [Gammaproteobacteria bacterium]|nr:2-oxobutyrate oxidase [Gammaproteobacteria bacterium]